MAAASGENRLQSSPNESAPPSPIRGRDTIRSPGVVILDHTLSVRRRIVGNRIGGYPDLPSVLEAVRQLSGE